MFKKILFLIYIFIICFATYSHSNDIDLNWEDKYPTINIWLKEVNIISNNDCCFSNMICVELIPDKTRSKFLNQPESGIELCINKGLIGLFRIDKKNIIYFDPVPSKCYKEILNIRTSPFY